MRRRGSAGDELQAHANDFNAQSSLNFLEDFLADAGQELIAEILGDIADAAAGTRDVDMGREVGIEAAGTAAQVRGNLAGQAAFHQSIERVVDGGEAHALVVLTHHGVEIFCRGVRVHRPERGVDQFTLARVSQMVILKQMLDPFGFIKMYACCFHRTPVS